jgi:hypothetical protein
MGGLKTSRTGFMKIPIQLGLSSTEETPELIVDLGARSGVLPL